MNIEQVILNGIYKQDVSTTHHCGRFLCCSYAECMSAHLGSIYIKEIQYMYKIVLAQQFTAFHEFWIKCLCLCLMPYAYIAAALEVSWIELPI